MTDDVQTLKIDSLDLEGQGVGRSAAGKVVFVDGALPGETVRARTIRRKKQWEQATLLEVVRESPQRVPPACPHFGLHPGACGGCKMQHFDAAAQVAVKQRTLENNLWHLAKVRPDQLLRPIQGPSWRYRYRARLSVRYLAKLGTALVGFHERQSSHLADIRTCEVLPAHVNAMLLPLRALINAMQARDRLPQIELACGESAQGESAHGMVTALVLRHLEPLGRADLARLRAFAAEHGVQWWLQPQGPDTVHLLEGVLDGVSDGEPHEPVPELAYRLPEFGLVMPFKPTDFTQVNHAINRVLVDRAVRLLDAQPQERVIDWFCGLGNFTLPIATRAAEVLGLEGSEALVARSRQNAARNGLAHKATFAARNLFEMSPRDVVACGAAQRWLVDPPREGAFALAKALAELHGDRPATWQPPQRIVYVSCNPSTLARDAGLLVHQAGYRLTMAGVVNMFPHTAHVESMAVFDRV